MISPAGYTVDGSENIVCVAIGPHTFTAVRPHGPALRLLIALHATRAVEGFQSPAGPPVAPATEQAPPTPNDALRTLQGLVADGLITADEYEQRRHEILERK